MGKSQKKTEKVTDETKETEEMMRKNPAPATSSEVPENVSASTSTSIPAGASQPRPAKPKFPADGLPTLEPWMKQTVVLQLKEVNGRVPDMTSEIFGKKMILEQGFSKAETLSVQSFARGIFYITFGSFQVCRRYWEMVKTSGPESPFRKFVANCPITQDEKWVTVAMRNPHTQSRDITTYLQRFCTVVKDPVRILDVNGFWIGKWSVLCKLRKDRSGDLQHLQACFSLGSSAGHLFYSGIPYNCNRCGRPGHMGKECTELACKICRVTGHETKDCPRPKACNLCGLPEHTFRHCPQRTRTYAGALIQGKPASSSGKKPTESKPKEPRKATELFAQSIRRNPEIRGITAPGPERREVKCSLYMDDVTVFCADQRSIDTLVQTCEDFGQASGAKVNCGKSEVMLFGKWFLPSSAPIPFSLKADFIKILGVWFGAEGAALKSWEERLAKMRQKFGLWSNRVLTIEGKTLVLRSEILPVLQYLAQAWPPPGQHLQGHHQGGVSLHLGLQNGQSKADCYVQGTSQGRTLVDRTVDSGGNSMSRFFLLPLWRSLGWDKWDSSVPYNWDPPWYYLDTFKFIKELGLHGVKPDLWKPKTIYKLIRASDILESIPGLPSATCKVVWRNVSSKRLINRHKDQAWMAIQGGLLLRTFLHARHLGRYTHCPFCIIQEETSHHVFWECCCVALRTLYGMPETAAFTTGRGCPSRTVAD
ncbi:uncharacterized protein LOC120941104 [Rana temporaria]|uniref:uncharacterized protein LOC120941104 n=1 Tax=Rana temporaria TaxID=8407 RepID=UPI001AADBBD7|nr:uncharacterized protein LOC120941104 [Rana temporaria]